jgi:hypothetical protein
MMADDDLNGADYRAVRRLSNGDDDVTYAEVGETCERVPVESLAGLLTHGYIEPASASGDRAVQAAHDALAESPAENIHAGLGALADDLEGEAP